jgi:hypothetical protein
MDSFNKAWKSGKAGFQAMAIQVCSLMWLRTIMNYQYKNGTSIKETVRILYKQGGVKRFYAGLLPGLIQGPVSRFGDTFANTFALSSLEKTNLPIFVKTMAASLAAGGMRILLTPIDTFKTMSQVQGKEAFNIIKSKLSVAGPVALYYGALANAAATIIGHYPWFVTHNYLHKYLPTYDDPKKKLLRNAFIGFTCSLISDTCSNFMRVIKTYRQTDSVKKPYIVCVKEIIQKSGLTGLFFRGLGVRLFTNGIQGLLFNVLWKMFDKGEKK